MLGFVAVAIAPIAMATVKTFLLTQTSQPAAIAASNVRLDAAAMAARLGGALTFRTVSNSVENDRQDDQFNAFRAYMEQSYPRVHRTLRREIIGDHHAALYTWEGSEPSMEPWMFVSHQDVVPVEPETKADWTHPPFSGAVSDGHVWGRGALDLKVTVCAALEAVRYLLDMGFGPRRTIFFAFGADEEVGGETGAKLIAAVLKERGVRLAFTLDEGGIVLSDAMPGVKRPVALIGLAEKGELTLRLTARDAGGHSAMPSLPTTIGRLGQAVARIEQTPMPVVIDRPISDFFDFVGPEAAPPFNVLYTNLWLTAPLLKQVLQGQPATDALIRTTAAATLVSGGVADNVLPQLASATINFRLRPGDRIDDVIAHVNHVMGDLDIDVETVGGLEASSVSSTDNAAFRMLALSLVQVLPDVIVAPYLSPNQTDSRYYASIARDQYRVVPMRMNSGDLDRIHGTDERISVVNYAEIVRFLIQFIVNVDAI